MSSGCSGGGGFRLCDGCLGGFFGELLVGRSAGGDDEGEQGEDELAFHMIGSFWVWCSAVRSYANYDA